MARRATRLLASERDLLLVDLVVAETVYVLESFYEAPRGQAAEAIRSLIAFDSIVCVDPALLLRAVEVYETMLSKWPMDPTAPDTQNSIAETYDQLNITKRPGTPEHDAIAQKALEARTKLANYIGNTPWVDANKDNPAAIQNAERLVRGGHLERELVGELEPRLVPARKRLARVVGLELGERIAPPVSLHAVEPHGARAERAREVQLERRAARLQRRGGREREQPVVAALDRHVHGVRALAQRHALERLPLGVQAHHVRRLRDPQVRVGGTRVIRAVGVQPKVDRLEHGDDVGAQSNVGRIRGGRAAGQRENGQRGQDSAGDGPEHGTSDKGTGG